MNERFEFVVGAPRRSFARDVDLAAHRLWHGDRVATYWYVTAGMCAGLWTLHGGNVLGLTLVVIGMLSVYACNLLLIAVAIGRRRRFGAASYLVDADGVAEANAERTPWAQIDGASASRRWIALWQRSDLAFAFPKDGLEPSDPAAAVGFMQAAIEVSREPAVRICGHGIREPDDGKRRETSTSLER